jgi:alkanesulfonate monooxygenase SsuD/methylene tetrahydromethanopterin reductase-like flavin-dependent oxidoreductase (luciferase family)
MQPRAVTPAAERAEIMATIAANLQAVQARIAQAAIDAQRVPDSVQLLAVSKTQGAAHVNEAWRCGQRAFGENSVQEALGKMRELEHLDISVRCRAINRGPSLKNFPGCTALIAKKLRSA